VARSTAQASSMAAAPRSSPSCTATTTLEGRSRCAERAPGPAHAGESPSDAGAFSPKKDQEQTCAGSLGSSIRAELRAATAGRAATRRSSGPAAISRGGGSRKGRSGLSGLLGPSATRGGKTFPGTQSRWLRREQSRRRRSPRRQPAAAARITECSNATPPAESAPVSTTVWATDRRAREVSPSSARGGPCARARRMHSDRINEGSCRGQSKSQRRARRSAR
jgi:hypothetical protein